MEDNRTSSIMCVYCCKRKELAIEKGDVIDDVLGLLKQVVPRILDLKPTW